MLLVPDHVFDPLPPQVRPRLLYHEQVAPSQEETVAGYVEPLPSGKSENIIEMSLAAYYARSSLALPFEL